MTDGLTADKAITIVETGHIFKIPTRYTWSGRLDWGAMLGDYNRYLKAASDAKKLVDSAQRMELIEVECQERERMYGL